MKPFIYLNAQTGASSAFNVEALEYFKWYAKIDFFCDYYFSTFFFFLKFLEDMSPFCGATDTPVLDF